MQSMIRSYSPDEVTVFATACPRNCYSTCSLKVRVAEGRIIGIDPHAANLSGNEGPCIKGLSYIERAESPDRILYPLKRNADGVFNRISWEEAFELISTKLRDYRNKFGPHSILFHAASGMSGLLNTVSTNFWRLFGGVTLTYGNLCWPAGLEATRLTLGANKHNVPWDLENARLIILWGKNPAETNIQEMMPIDKSLEQGGRLIVVDPRRTPSSDRAEILVQIKPGTDAALALGIARELICNDWIDKDFINSYVKGYDEFASSVEAYTPEMVSEICGLPESGIKDLARMIGNTKPMTLVPGFGMQRYSNGGQTIRCLLALQVITGNIGKPGACWHYANLQSYVFDEIKEPESYYPGTEDKSFRREVSVAKLGEDILKLKDPEIKMIWVERGNPLTQNPDSNLILKAYRKADFKVVIEQFMTDTAREADLILPSKNMFEQADIIGSYWNPYVQLKQKIIEPAGEVKPETEIYYELAHRLGFHPEEIKKNIPEPNDKSVNIFLEKYLESYPELSMEELKTGPQLADCHEEIPFADGRFPTPSGKIELLSEEANIKWGLNKLPSYDPLQSAPENFPLQLLSPNSKNRIHSQFNNLQIIKQFEKEAVLYMNPHDAISRGLKNHEMVDMRNDKGDARVKICFDMGIRKTCVVLTNGHWHSDGASPNLFTRGKETDMGHGTAFHDNWVEVKKI